MYKIGEFAKLVGSTSKTLRFYDDENILKATYIDKMTGYRYYSVYKISEFNKINTLKSLSFSLKEIKNMQETKNDSDILQIFEQKRIQLENDALQVKLQLKEILKMENEFNKTMKLYENQKENKYKITNDNTHISISFECADEIKIPYKCNFKVDLYDALLLLTQVINGKGVVNLEYQDAINLLDYNNVVVEIFKSGTNLTEFIRETTKTAIVLFEIGKNIDLEEIFAILQPLSDNSINLMFAVCINEHFDENTINSSMFVN